MDEQTRFKLTTRLFEAINNEYKSMFPGREWDPYFFNYFFPFVKHTPHVLFSWNIEEFNDLVARFEYPWDKNKGGLFNHLRNNCDIPELFEWINADFEFTGPHKEDDPRFGRVFIKFHIGKINYDALMSDGIYQSSIVNKATRAMKVLEDALWSHVKSYFNKHPE